MARHMGKVTYSIAVDQAEPVAGSASFTVIRDVADTGLHPTVWWVYVRCYGEGDDEGFWPVNALGQADYARVVVWGLQPSVEGHTAALAVQGVRAVAWLTDRAPGTKVGWPSVEFTVAP